MSRSLLAALVASLLVLASLTSRAQDPAAVEVADAYVRAVPPGQPNSAVYMTLTNRSSEARALVEATSPAAEVAELHTHVHEDGMMRMRRVERIELPAGESVSLQPGGLHLMLIGLRGDLEAGGQVEVILSFDDGAQAKVLAPVRQVEPMKMAH